MEVDDERRHSPLSYLNEVLAQHQMVMANCVTFNFESQGAGKSGILHFVSPCSLPPAAPSLQQIEGDTSMAGTSTQSSKMDWEPLPSTLFSGHLQQVLKIHWTTEAFKLARFTIPVMPFRLLRYMRRLNALRQQSNSQQQGEQAEWSQPEDDLQHWVFGPCYGQY